MRMSREDDIKSCPAVDVGRVFINHKSDVRSESGPMFEMDILVYLWPSVFSVLSELRADTYIRKEILSAECPFRHYRCAVYSPRSRSQGIGQPIRRDVA